MSIFAKATALAIFADIWAGDLPCALVPFKTKRNGLVVIRYRWISDRGSVVGGWSGAFASVKQGVASASRHHSFSNIRDITPEGWAVAA